MQAREHEERGGAPGGRPPHRKRADNHAHASSQVFVWPPRKHTNAHVKVGGAHCSRSPISNM